MMPTSRRWPASGVAGAAWWVSRVLVIPLTLCCSAFGLPAPLCASIQDDADRRMAELEQAVQPTPDLEPSAAATVAPPPASGTAPAEVTNITLVPTQIRSIPVDNMTRVVIGGPEVVDVHVASANEVLLQAKAPGTTDLMIWDQQGQHVWSVEVQDPTREAVDAQLRAIVGELNLSQVTVQREGDKLFLVGEVDQPEDADRLEQMISAFEKVTNLVKVATPPPPPAPPLPSIKLTVQLIEMTRDDTDKLGVDWADKLTFTETTFGALTPQDVSLHERIDEAFRFGSLSRTGLNPVLNMLISNGKARILAEPKLVAASGKSAEATMGVEIPIITTTSVSSGTVSQNIEFKQTGVELKFMPTLLSNGESIQTQIDARVSSIDNSVAITVNGIVVPGFRIRQTKTEIVTGTGESVLISGLLQDEEKRNLSQVPGVGSIPVLGTLFRSTQFIRGKTELIVVVTPELMSQGEASEDRTVVLEQALSSAEGAGSANDPTLRYALQVQDRIAKSLRYPQREKERGISGQVKLRLHLFRDGTLEKATVVEPSGVEVLDAAALKAAEGQSPYPPFPADLFRQDLWLELPVIFQS